MSNLCYFSRIIYFCPSVKAHPQNAIGTWWNTINYLYIKLFFKYIFHNKLYVRFKSFTVLIEEKLRTKNYSGYEPFTKRSAWRSWQAWEGRNKSPARDRYFLPYLRKRLTCPGNGLRLAYRIFCLILC